MIPKSIAVLLKKEQTPQEALESIRKLLAQGFRGFEYTINTISSAERSMPYQSEVAAVMLRCLLANKLDPSLGVQIISHFEKCREFWTDGYEDMENIKYYPTRVIGFMRYSKNLSTLSLMLGNSQFITALKGGPAYTIPPPETEVRLELDLDYPARLQPRAPMLVCGLSWPTTHGDGDEAIFLTQSRSEIRWILWLRTSLYDWFPERRRKILVMPIAWTRRDIKDQISAAKVLLSAYFSDRGEIPNKFSPGIIDGDAYKTLISKLSDDEA
jgi:hypothetical protein